MSTHSASFTVQMTPGAPIPAGTGRFDLVRTWSGEVEGTSVGVMLTAGDPGSGSAGYVAIETFTGTLAGRSGTVVLQQLGTMAAGEPALTYVITPGSGTGELAGLTGTLAIGEIDDQGLHRVTLELD